MAETRHVDGRPTIAPKRYLQEIGANKWFDKNVDRTEDLVPGTGHHAVGHNGASVHDDGLANPHLGPAPVLGLTSEILPSCASC